MAKVSDMNAKREQKKNEEKARREAYETAMRRHPAYDGRFDKKK